MNYRRWTAGNESPKVATAVAPGAANSLFDDASPELKLTGHWQHREGLQPAYQGTISESDQKGDVAELTFTGKRLLIFCKLGPKGGKASVSFDGDSAAETFDTFSADDIWSVAVYQKEFATSGSHSLRITVLGEHGPRSEGNGVALDGVRVEAE